MQVRPVFADRLVIARYIYIQYSWCAWCMTKTKSELKSLCYIAILDSEIVIILYLEYFAYNNHGIGSI